jgi:hypothetical protein
MLSKALTQLFERARTRFGVDVQILDGSLQPLYPDAETALDRAIRESDATRVVVEECVTTGRPGHVLVGPDGKDRYDLVPLRLRPGANRPLALASLRLAATATDRVRNFWADFVRATIEADAENLEALAEERGKSRRLLGTLRFLRHLAPIDAEADVAYALIQSAAIWFDADARVYRRDLNGEFLLYAALPGAVIEPAARRMALPPLGEGVELHRTSSAALWGDANGHDVTLVLLGAGEEPASVLVLLGAKVDDETHLPAVAQVAGIQMERARVCRRDGIRQRFLGAITNPDTTADAPPTAIVRDLAALAGAANATLMLERDGRVRTLVSIGTPVAYGGFGSRDAQPGTRFERERFVCAMPLRRGVATLELRPASGEAFSVDAAMVAQVAAEVLHTWLRAVEPSLVEAPIEDAPAQHSGSFLERIEEELQRAKRFDLCLSLVLVDVPANREFEIGLELMDALRRELRGSDVLGPIGGRRMAALLTHTDATGSHRVVERLRQRLAESASSLGIGGIIVGHAAFSPECRTADALVSTAARDAVPVASVS